MVENVIKDIGKMTDVEGVRKIADAAKSRLEGLTKLKLRAGDKVQMLPKHRGAKPYDTVGRVERVNKKTISIDFGTFGKWRVGPSLLQIV